MMSDSQDEKQNRLDVNVKTASFSEVEEQLLYKKLIQNSTHFAPQEFKYCLKIQVQSQFLILLGKENHEFIGNFHTVTGGVPFILTGGYKVNETDIWIVNQELTGYYLMWFKSRDEAAALWKYVHDKIPKPSKVNTIYKYTPPPLGSGWQHANNFSKRDSIDLIGYNHYVDVIQKDMANYFKYTEFLKSIGEGSRTLNYLLYGPPGTGKTTLIKTLGSENNIPIFIVNPSSMGSASASELLNPKIAGVEDGYEAYGGYEAYQTMMEESAAMNGGTAYVRPAIHGGTKIVLFEDFDRYLQEGKYSMSEILNELDGIESTEGVVRFFTANNIDEMMRHDALINRMSAKFEFFKPTMEHFTSKLDRFLTLYPAEWREENKDKIAAFMKLVETQCVGKLTLRPFSNYVIRYLFDTNCMELMIAHIEELK